MTRLSVVPKLTLPRPFLPGSPAFALEQTFWWLQALFPLVPLLPHLRAAAPRVVLAGKQAVQIARPLDSANAAKAGEFVLHHVGQAAKELPLHVLVGAAGLTALFIGSTCVCLSVPR